MALNRSKGFVVILPEWRKHLVTALGEEHERLPQSSEVLVDLIRAVGRTKDSTLAIELLPFVWPIQVWARRPWGNRWVDARRIIPEAVRLAAIDTVHGLVARLPAEFASAFDEQVRGKGRHLWAVSHHPGMVKPPRLSELEQSGRIAEICILSCHADGYVREEAVAKLAAGRAAEALPFLLLRTADWVPAIRRLAISAAGRYAEVKFADELVRVLPLVLQLEASSRASTDLVGRIESVLLADSDLSALAKGLERAEAAARRAVVRFADRGQLSAPFIDKVARDCDPMVRRWALAWSEDRREGDPLHSRQVIEAFCQDVSPGLRKRALMALFEIDPDAALGRALGFLTDNSAGVRESASYIVRKTVPEIRLVEFYRDAVRKDASPGVVAGLAEWAEPADEILLRSLLGGVYRSSVSQAALRGLARLLNEEVASLLLEALCDSRPGMRRVAATLLPQRLPADFDLWGVWERAPYDGRRKVAALASRLPTWPALNFLLRIIADAGDLLPAEDALKLWIRRVHERPYVLGEPEPHMKSSLVGGLQAAAPFLGPSLLNKLCSIIENPRTVGHH